MEWWGLYEDGELIAVRHFRFTGDRLPSIWDFDVSFSSDCEYEICRVYITKA